jgi:hypothetical protein
VAIITTSSGGHVPNRTRISNVVGGMIGTTASNTELIVDKQPVEINANKKV